MKSILDFYNKNAMELSCKYESAQMEFIHSLLLKTFPQKSSLLELGCGSGRDAAFMVSNGFKLTAIDGSAEMIRMALLHHPQLNGFLYKKRIPDELDFAEESFDGIYSIAMLMHFSYSELTVIFEKINCMMKKKSKFLFSVSVNRKQDDTERYFNKFTKNDWIELGKKYNMKILFLHISDDGLGREEIQWFTCIMKKISY